ncbi:acyl-CoA dehydrogenase family protein [Pseudorhodoferax sp.]|uniref:acyl-CoA dehydrogenase family protein n=1 Tax=Pseudorhodoferax sp. TaxID=1993553 RepID=UPI002DD69CB0|nr:acyl-CoA dehydrogenase family protein [Pseudorhodoferax sp.]
MYIHTEQTRALIDLVRRLVDDHQMPLETRLLRGETLTRADKQPGVAAARAAGLWRLNCPAEQGGPGLSLVERLAITEENFRCLVPIRFGGDALPPTFALQGEQKRRYLDPFLAGEQTLCMAQTEPGGGGDPAGAILTHARETARGWVINGAKIWISGYEEADTVFVLARTDKHKGASGISMLAVAKGNPGMHAREVPMLGGFKTHQLTFSDCEVDALALIGGEGTGFKGAQQALSAARFDVAARALGVAQRAYEMMVAHAKQRVAFGGPLAEKQAVQSMVVDSWIELQQNRLMLYHGAGKNDRGEDTRLEAGMLKMLCTEMADRVIDRAIQVHGAAGCTYESPLAHWYDHQRMARIYEGPTDVHKYRVVARALLA